MELSHGWINSFTSTVTRWCLPSICFTNGKRNLTSGGCLLHKVVAASDPVWRRNISSAKNDRSCMQWIVNGIFERDFLSQTMADYMPTLCAEFFSLIGPLWMKTASVAFIPISPFNASRNKCAIFIVVSLSHFFYAIF